MGKFSVIFVLCTTIFFWGCSGGSINNNESSSGTSVCSYGTYECHGNYSYFCGHPDSGNDLMWFAEKCDNGCDDSIGKCKPDSDNPDTTPDDGDTEPDNSDSADDTDSSDSGNDSGDSQSDDDDDTRKTNCDPKPDHTEWNDNGEEGQFTQTWNGEEWIPATHESVFSKTPKECAFKCVTGFYWDENKCYPSPTQTNECSGLPENAQWNTVSTITQTWDGESWYPSSIASYNETPSQTECRFKCIENYEYNSSSLTCEGAKRISECTGLEEDIQWNTVSSITQQWNGEEWLPDTTGIYSETASSSECHYKCASGYSRDGTKCTRNQPSSGSRTLGNICTGQNKCYNDSKEITCPTSSSTIFFGQDAQYAAQGTCAPQSFTVQTISNQEVVLDNNTGLMWQQRMPTEGYTLGDAGSYCSSLTYAGYSDWRLPTQQELLTIVDISRYDPALDTSYFPDTPSYDFWSSSAWIVSFYDGDTENCSKFYDGDVENCSTTDRMGVWCVRGSTLPTSSFNSSTVNGDVIVIDTKTGLIWQKSYASHENWLNALHYCESLIYAGKSDWRLPNRNELASLVNYAKHDPASDFPNMPSEYFWSSSTDRYKPDAWIVSFDYGDMYGISKDNDHYHVRCVR